MAQCPGSGFLRVDLNVARSLFEPELLRKNIDEKQRQLEEIQEDLNKLPLEDPLRTRWLERMWHLQKGIPELEAKLAEHTRAQPRDSQEIHKPHEVQTKLSRRRPEARPGISVSSSSASQRVASASVDVTDTESPRIDFRPAKPNTGKKPTQSSPGRASKRRAKLLAKVLEELLMLKEDLNFELEEDFKAAQRHSIDIASSTYLKVQTSQRSRIYSSP